MDVPLFPNKVLPKAAQNKFFHMKVGDKMMTLIQKSTNTFKATLYSKMKNGTIRPIGGPEVVLKGDTAHVGASVWKRVQ